MRIEATHTTGAYVADKWGAEPNLRAEIKNALDWQIALKLRLEGLIDYVVTKCPTTGDTIVTASLEASSTGDERRAAGFTVPPTRLDRLELALHQIIGHGNITVERAKAIAAEALNSN